MKALKAAIIVGAVSAAITWAAVYLSIHEPTSRRMPDGSLCFILSYPPGDDDDLTASLWAAGAYVLTFTPTFLLLHVRTRKDVFAKRQFPG